MNLAYRVALAGLLGLVVFVFVVLGGGPRPSKQRWTFLETAMSPTELGFHPSGPRHGVWTLEEHEEATGARALVNREGEDASPPATMVAQTSWSRDVTAMTRCKTDPARTVQACGLVFRFRDDANYEVARLDTTIGQAILASVVAGRERELARAPAPAAPNVWHDLPVDASRGLVRVSWNARPLIEAMESLPAFHGRIGLWAPAAGVAYFDELSIEELTDSARPLEILPFLARPRT